MFDEFWKALGTYHGPQIVLAALALLLVFGYFFARLWLAPGSQRLDVEQGHKEQERKDALSILQGINGEQKARIEAQNDEIIELRSRLAGFEWMNTNSGALKERAAKIEAESRGEVPAIMGLARLLVVDDDKGAREMMQLHLSRLGFTVKLAYSAQRGLELCDKARANAEAFDLIIADEAMLGMSGQQMLLELRRKGDRTRAVFLTGHAEQLAGSLAPELYDVKIWRKPLDYVHLSAYICEALEE